MPLIEFDDRYRRMWMFPRNIRRISPWKIAQIVSLINELKGESYWSGNQELQNIFCKALESAGLKDEGEQYDPRSGGPRTYFSQLKCLGLIFQREDGRIFTTQAGEDLISGEPPLPILQSLILRHQYPSLYGTLSNVGMDPRLRVKPFLFILKLLLHPDIRYLTNEELCVPIVYGHNHDCLSLCIDKILKMRKGLSFIDVVDNPNKDIYTRRIEGNPLAKRVAAARDIANTFKNCLQAVCLIDVEKIDCIEQCRVNKGFLPLIKNEFENIENYIPLKTEESFQRNYGSWRSEKDTRSLIEKPKHTSPEKAIILGLFYEYAGQTILDSYPEAFTIRMKDDFGFSQKLVDDVITPHLSTSLSYFESTYLNLASGGIKAALDFEKSTSEIFSSRLKFKTKLTGQLKRTGKGAFSDIFAIALDDIHCAIIDAKASSSYSLSSDDYYKMHSNYIPNYLELSNGKPLLLEFCAYVAGGFNAIEPSLKKLTKDTGIGVSAITAFDLLRLAQGSINSGNQPALRKVFMSNKILKYNDFQ
ncbi:MAG TPA: hypothetical protein DET40_18430 [Lentisphaeria bacterium]|nr:MAG: hypothetical protein A2X45_14570 [Lentisphaerae bacterium GWF2_50_93]HCE45521.1 hypothetical protein [Lentisphaeria bacterium]